MVFDNMVTFEGRQGAPAGGLIIRMNGAEAKAVLKAP